MVSTTLLKPVGQSNNNRGGSGRFVPLRRGRRGEYNPFAIRTQSEISFKGQQDPLYMVFEYLDNQPVSKLASDFVKENIKMPIDNFVSIFSR